MGESAGINRFVGSYGVAEQRDEGAGAKHRDVDAAEHAAARSVDVGERN